MTRRTRTFTACSCHPRFDEDHRLRPIRKDEAEQVADSQDRSPQAEQRHRDREPGLGAADDRNRDSLCQLPFPMTMGFDVSNAM